MVTRGGGNMIASRAEDRSQRTMRPVPYKRSGARSVKEMPVETTLYSISSDPPPAESRRSSERHLTIFRVGSIFIEGTRELCLVKNISAGGALIRAYCSLEVGQELMIEIKEGNPVPGRVSWLRGSDSGIEFGSPIDVVDLLTAGSEGRRPRMPRIETHCIGFVREGAVVHRAHILNISQGGIAAEIHNALTVGADVTVSLTGLPPQQGVVRWGAPDCYGIAFNNVIGLPVLIDWLHRTQGSAA